MADETFFDLPNSPEEFGIILPQATLNRIDFSALEFPTMRRILVEYIKTYYPDEFNDFVTSNGAIMFLEQVAMIGAILATREDIIADEAFLPTAQTRDAVEQHLALINRPLKRQTPAVVDVSVSVSAGVPTGLRIPAGTKFTLTGADGNSLIYEIFRAPGDFTNDIEILPNKIGTIAYGIEGVTATPTTAISSGGADQSIVITDPDVLEDPIIVEVSTGNTSVRWTRVDALETRVAEDEVYEVRFTEDGATILFGNDVNGKAPLSGQVISVTYRTGGGIRGRIGANFINTSLSISPEAPATAPVEVFFRNLSPSSGGENAESIEIAKRVAPKEAATVHSATTGEDYAVLAKNFRSPTYGSVLKAVATVRTEINANVVELHVLAEGPDGPVLPGIGMKRGLEAFFADIQVLTDEIRVLNGAIKPVDVSMDVIIDRNADPSVVRAQVLAEINDFFDISNRDMGEPLFRSRLISVIDSVDGVLWVNILEPDNNIRRIDANETDEDGVKFNELITLGNQDIRFWYDRQASQPVFE
jgi:hypothetical protein